MMMRSQKGYLLIVTLFLIFIMGTLSAAMVLMFSSNTTSAVVSSLSTQAYYIAESGINIGVRYWYSKSVNCDSITGNGDLTNHSIGNGEFTVTGTSIKNASTLSAAISATDTTIPLASTSGFPAQGVVTIGTEAIYYTGVSGNSLTGAFRGVASTVAAIQSSASAVTQNSCLLTSTGAVKNLTSPQASRTMQAVMFAFPATSAGTTYGTITARNKVSIVNSNVTNGHTCLTCPNYVGSNVQTNSKNNTFTGFSTQVGANAADDGNLTTSSYQGSIKPDIEEGTKYSNATLHDLFFSQTANYIRNNADYVGTNVINKSGVIYANGSINTSNGSLGSPSNPILLYVAGSITLSSVSVYGIIFATGKVTFTNMSMQGAVATRNQYSQNGVGMAYSYSVLSYMAANPPYNDFLNVGSITGGGGETKSLVPANIEEVFS